jgi:hypothetical protein
VFWLVFSIPAQVWLRMASNTSNATNSNNVTKQQPAPAPKDSLQEEQQLEDMLDRLDQVHLQASLPRQSTCHPRDGVVFSDSEMQLRQLRSALPRMLEPLRTKQSSRTSSQIRLRQPTN